MSKSRAEQIIETLDLRPLPMEGGYYVETYRSDENIPLYASRYDTWRHREWATLPERYPAERSFSTAIYFLLTPDVFSAMHRVKSDEVFHFYLGDPVELLMLHPDGTHELITIGPDVLAGQRPQVIVPNGVWQGARLREDGEFALLGTTVAPGFEFEDYEHGDRAALVSDHPACEKLIVELTRDSKCPDTAGGLHRT